MSDNNWLNLLDKSGAAFHNSDELKAALPIPYVLEAAGHKGYMDDGKYITRCPFHADQSPSFDVFGENLERWGCYPCGDGGDVFDLIGKLWHIEKFIHRKDKAAELLSQLRREGWAGPTKGIKRVYDGDEGKRLVLNSEGGQDAAWLALHDELAATRAGLGAIDPDDVRADFKLGTYGSDTIIPFYDRDMNLIAYKRRRPGGKAMAASGADFSPVFYAEWLDDGRAPVLLCEGESDVWAATYALPTWTVLGLPTGVGAHPVQAEKLKGRDVVLAFDGDDAGRLGLVKWYAALTGAGVKSVRIVVMPDDADLSTVPNIPELVDSAQSVPPIPQRISAQPDGLYRIPKGEKAEPEPLSNFTLIPKRQLVGDGLSAWECVMEPGNKSVVITTLDLSKDSTMVDWAARHGGSWYGSRVDAQHLQAWLQSVQPFLAAGYTTAVAGLHENHFVFPDGRIGPDHWVYAPGRHSVEMERYIEGLTNEGPWDFVKQLRQMRELHRHDVMDPILAWLAIAPLRSLLNPFPTLAVLGGSGTGKTTLLETVLRAFTGTEIGVNLASTTRFAIQGLTASTNAFPVWFDEYRPGAAEDALAALDQIVRDAYNGHGSIKGGMGAHWAELKMLKSEAPMIVSGEDAFTETSHVERIIPLYLPMDGRNSETLTKVQSWGDTRFAWKWLEILRYGLVEGDINLTVAPLDVPGLAPRMQYNLGVLQLGWDLLSYYAERIAKVDLGAPDFSLVIQNWTEEAKGSPIVDAIRWCLDEPNASDFISMSGDQIHIRVNNFVTYVKRQSQHKLPGNATAVRRYLMEQLGGVESRTRMFDRQVRTIAVHADTIQQEVE